jgi:hypothetical protein
MLIKQYATLHIREYASVLLDDKGNTILLIEQGRQLYNYNYSKIFNVLSSKGWNIEYKMDEFWFMMSKIL